MGDLRSAAWTVLSQRALDTYVVAKFFYGDGTRYLPVSSGPIHLEGEDYLPLLLEIPTRRSSIDYWTREFSVSDMLFSIINSPFQGSTRFSDLLDTSGSGIDRGYMNRRVEARLWRPGITTFDDCLLLSNVVVRPPEQVGRDVITLNAEDESTLSLKQTLDQIPATDAADTDEGLPAETVGRILPIIGGSHKFNRGNDSKALDTVDPKNNGVRCGYLGVDVTTDEHLWRVSKHQLSAVGVASEQNDFWVKDEALGRQVRVEGVTVVQNNANGCIVSHPNNPTLIDYVYGRRSVADKVGDGSTDLAPIENVGDKDFSTVATGQLFEGDGFVDIGDFIAASNEFAPWENQDIDDADISAVNVHYYGKLTLSGGIGAGNVIVGMENVGTTVAPQTLRPTAAAYPDARIVNDAHATIFPATKAAVAATSLVRLEADVVFSTNWKAIFEVYQMYKAIQYVKGGLLQLYAAVDGLILGTWINNRGTADGYTVNHADNNNSGSLGENRASLLESYLRDVLGLTDSQIDMEAFNVASTVLSGVNGSYSIIEDVNTIKQLFELAREYQCFMWWDASGKVSIVALPDTVTSDEVTIIDGNLISNLVYGRTDAENLHTGVEVEYSGYENVARGITPLVEDSDAQLGNAVTVEQSKLRYPSIGYREEAAAISFGNHRLANDKNIHNTASGAAPIMYAHLGIGSIIGFENIPLTLRGEDLTQSYTVAGQTILPYFIIIDVDRSDELIFMAVQLHELTT